MRSGLLWCLRLTQVAFMHESALGLAGLIFLFLLLQVELKIHGNWNVGHKFEDSTVKKIMFILLKAQGNFERNFLGALSSFC